MIKLINILNEIKIKPSLAILNKDDREHFNTLLSIYGEGSSPDPNDDKPLSSDLTLEDYRIDDWPEGEPYALAIIYFLRKYQNLNRDVIVIIPNEEWDFNDPNAPSDSISAYLTILSKTNTVRLTSNHVDDNGKGKGWFDFKLNFFNP